MSSNKKMNVVNVAIITPGGDAPGMNACIRAAVRAGISRGFKMYGIKRGYSGLLGEDIEELNMRAVSGIIHHGGTILKSTRCDQIKKESGIKRAAAILKKYELNHLIVIGGDGSIRAARRISERGLSVFCIPASIDNDIFGTEETIGYDTAIDTATDAIDKIRDTATSFERVFIIEVMGREHGFLALDVALAAGAEYLVVPEYKVDTIKISNDLKTLSAKGKTSVIIIFAEGAGDSREFAKVLSKNTGLDVKVSSLGYIQRGGTPSARTRILASKFAAHAVELISDGRRNRVITLRQNRITDLSIGAVTAGEKTLDKTIYDLVTKLGS